MKTLLPILFLLMTPLCVTQVFAQPAPPQRQPAQVRLMPVIMKIVLKTVAEGKSAGMFLAEDGDDPEFQAVTGTTNEQFAEYYNFMMDLKSKMEPQMKQLMAAAEEADDDALEDIGNQMETIFDGIYDQVAAKLEEIVTPEQLQKMRQLDLQIESPMVEAGFPLINFEAYTALDLSDSQKKQLDKIREESLPEQQKYMAEMLQLMPKPGQRPKPEEMQSLQEKMTKKTEDGKKLLAKIRSRILVTLDKKQQDKLERLLVERPAYVTNRFKLSQPTKPVDAKKFDAWKSSWKPGDPLPEEFLQEEKRQRRGRFPSMR